MASSIVELLGHPVFACFCGSLAFAYAPKLFALQIHSLEVTPHLLKFLYIQCLPLSWGPCLALQAFHIITGIELFLCASSLPSAKNSQKRMNIILCPQHVLDITYTQLSVNDWSTNEKQELGKNIYHIVQNIFIVFND